MKYSLSLFAFILPALAIAQNDQPASQNLLTNGSFEFSTPTDNIWDGVDSEGYLAGFRKGMPAITEGGAVADLAMPISVQAADLNGDGLLDLITADPRGYYRVYFNSGTKTEPKFTIGEIIPFFPSGFPGTDWHDPSLRRLAPKICLADTTKSGKMDLIIGDYGGDILIVPNTGSLKSPEFRQPNSYSDYEVKTTKAGNIWGNLFAPLAYDWNKDSKLDLLIGEGSYSANAIHLLINDGSSIKPVFTEEKSYFLAYGDGKEHLVPTVVDYNGDGIPDVLVGDSKGTISVYLGTGQWKPDDEYKLSSLVSFGSVTSLGGCICPAVADLNGDGLFDLIIGKSNGRIAVAYNKGTKTEPKFDMPVELKGTDLWNRNTMRQPGGWNVYTSIERGNFYGAASVVDGDEDKDAAPVDGKYALKLGWFPSPNKEIKYVPFVMPSDSTKDVFDNKAPQNWFFRAGPGDVQNVYWAGTSAPGNTFILRKLFTTPPKPGVPYILSFKVHGHGVKLAQWTIDFNGQGKHAQDKISRTERNAVRIERNESKDSVLETSTFPVTTQWTTVTKQITFKFQHAQDLNNPDSFDGIEVPSYWAGLDFHFSLENPSGVCYIDDVKFVEKK